MVHVDVTSATMMERERFCLNEKGFLGIESMDVLGFYSYVRNPFKYIFSLIRLTFSTSYFQGILGLA